MTSLKAIVALGMCISPAAAAGDGHRWWSHVVFLAGDNLEGRETGSEGHRRAAEYVAKEFAKSGLKAGAASGYLQPVRLASSQIDEDHSSLALIGGDRIEPLVLGEHAVIGTRTESPASVNAALVFAGYGLTIPEAHYDDLAGLDLRGKIAVYIGGGPGFISGPLRSHYQSSSERRKIWERSGAVGSVSIAAPGGSDVPWSRISLARLHPSMNLVDPSGKIDADRRLSITANPAYADKFLAGSGHTSQELLALVKEGKVLPTFPIPLSLDAKVAVKHADVRSENVVAIWPGSDRKLKNEYVVLSAHLDALGRGGSIKGDDIYNGAMDNASGIASLLEIAATLRNSGKRFRRSLLFVAVTAEEKGLLGSQYFADHPTVKAENMVADLNVDMFLPLFPFGILTAVGLEESDLGDRLRTVAAPMGVRIQSDPEPARNLFIRSDQYNFIRHGIPSLAFKLGYAKGSPEDTIARAWLVERYHAPSDDVNQPVDLKAAVDFDNLILMLAESIANGKQRPAWKQESFFRRFVRPAAAKNSRKR